MSTRQSLLQSAQALCNDFANKSNVDVLLSHFSSTHKCTAIEHGLPALAPFLGRPFIGLSGIREYFELIANLLSYENMKFSEYVVDAEVSKASVKGQAEFTWKSTGESWEEKFTYMLDFDDEGKVTDYQVWADSGAAYLARKGKLTEVVTV
jgi:hypothetical protein